MSRRTIAAFCQSCRRPLHDGAYVRERMGLVPYQGRRHRHDLTLCWTCYGTRSTYELARSRALAAMGRATRASEGHDGQTTS